MAIVSHTILLFSIFSSKMRTLKQKQLLCYVLHCLRALSLVETKPLCCLITAQMAEEMFKIPVKQAAQISHEVIDDNESKSLRNTVDVRFKDLQSCCCKESWGLCINDGPV